MLGVSFSEIVMIAIVALIVVGPRRLPEILGQMGRWVAKIRRMTTEVRKQTGIDEILRDEGISGGISELRSMMRGELNTMRGELDNLQRHGDIGSYMPPGQRPLENAVVDAYGESISYDRLREQPVEGVDSYGAIPEDLLAAAAPVAATTEATATPALPAAPGDAAASLPQKPARDGHAAALPKDPA